MFKVYRVTVTAWNPDEPQDVISFETCSWSDRTEEDMEKYLRDVFFGENQKAVWGKVAHKNLEFKFEFLRTQEFPF